MRRAGPGALGVPLGAHEALRLQGAKDAVEVRQVDALARQELAEPGEELVAVRGPLAEQEQQARLQDALDAGAHEPGARAVAAAAAACRPAVTARCLIVLYWTIAYR